MHLIEIFEIENSLLLGERFLSKWNDYLEKIY